MFRKIIKRTLVTSAVGALLIGGVVQAEGVNNSWSDITNGEDSLITDDTDTSGDEEEKDDGTLKDDEKFESIKHPQKTESGYMLYGIVEFGEWEGSPIQWQVLKVDGDKLVLFANSCVTKRQFNQDNVVTTWKTSTLRSWLNGYNEAYNNAKVNYTDDSFLQAFSEDELKAIQQVTSVNSKNPVYGTGGSYNTKDLVTLMSIEDASSLVYGYDDFNVASLSRSADAIYWLRDSGVGAFQAATVDTEGLGSYEGYSVNKEEIGVRPMIVIDNSVANLEVKDTVKLKCSNEDVKVVHDFTEEKFDEKTHWLECVCGYRDGEAEHDLETNKVTVEPTCTTNGVRTYYCSDCKYKKEEKIPVLNHVFVTVVDKKSSILQSGVLHEECKNCHLKKESVITPAQQDSTKVLAKVALKSAKSKKRGTVVIKFKKISGVTGYQVQYSTKKSFKKSKTDDDEISARAKQYKITELKSGKKYYVRMRTYVIDEQSISYGKWSKVYKVKVK